MKSEIIEKVTINDTRELCLFLKGTGDSMYQYIYREAVGVYWDNNKFLFKSTPLREWSPSDWFFHIISIVKSSLQVELKITSNTLWIDIPENEIEIIKTKL